MTICTLENLKRPKILVKAAQIGQRHYQRKKNLCHILGCTKLPSPEAAVIRLSEREHVINEERLQSEASYSITRHISLLTALLVESSFLEN